VGYELVIRCRNKILRNQMLEFLKEHYTLPHKLFNEPGDPIDKSYAELYEQSYKYFLDEYSVGFYYGSEIPEHMRTYLYSVSNWIALTVGRKHYYKNLKMSLSYIENLVHGIKPVIVTKKISSIPEKYRQYVTNRLGVIKIPGKNIETTKNNMLIKHKIKSMEILWKKQ
jgi:hypothetical protein